MRNNLFGLYHQPEIQASPLTLRWDHRFSQKITYRLSQHIIDLFEKNTWEAKKRP